jgi:hypothetical protein
VRYFNIFVIANNKVDSYLIIYIWILYQIEKNFILANK